MSFPEKIDGERIVLERAVPTFALATELLELVDESRDDLLPWLSWAEKNTAPEDEYGYLLNWCDKHWQDDEGYAYVIRKKADGKLLGTVDFMKIDREWKCGEIGYWLRSSEVGNGYMHEAVALLEKEVFKQDFNRIVITNDTRNIRSANVAKRAGYHLDGVLRQDKISEVEKIFVSTNIWSKLKEEYKRD